MLLPLSFPAASGQSASFAGTVRSHAACIRTARTSAGPAAAEAAVRPDALTLPRHCVELSSSESLAAPADRLSQYRKYRCATLRRNPDLCPEIIN